MKKVLKILIPVLLVAAVSVGAVFAYQAYQPYDLKSIQKDPLAQIQRSFTRTKSALQDGLAVTVPDTVHSATKHGAIQFDLFTEDKQHITSQLFLRDNGCAIVGSIPAEKEAIEFGFWSTREDIVLNTPTLLNDTAYGISLETIQEDAKSSALWEVLGISYDDIAPLFDMLTAPDMPNAEEQNPFTLLKLKTKLEDVVRSWPVSVVEETIIMDTTTVPVYRVSYTLSSEHICSLIDIACEYAEQLNIPGMEQDAMTQIRETLADSKAKIEESEAAAIIDIFLHGETQVIVQADYRIDWVEDKKPITITAGICLGADPVESAQYSLTAELSLPGQPKRNFSVDYHRTHAHNLPGRELTITSGGETYTVMQIQFNDITKAFALELLDGSVKIDGYWQNSEKEAAIHTNLEGLGEFSIKFLPEETMPEAPKYTNLLTLDKATLEALFGKGEIPPAPKDKAADIAITDTDGSRQVIYFMHNYENLGELLTEEEIAIRDIESGEIISICYDDFNGSEWKLYISGQLYPGNLFEVALENEISIAIIAAK